ncbi:MAG: hypothetical protein ACI4MI_04295 [Christensenellales bacterium]
MKQQTDKNVPKLRVFPANIHSNLQLKKYWWIFLVIAISSIIGLIIGIVVGKDIDNPDQFCPYLLLSEGGYSYFGSWFKISLYFALVIFIAFLSILNPLFSLISFGVIAFVGYRIGYSLTVAFKVNALTAIFSLILYYLPLWLLFMAVSAIIVIYNLGFNNCINGLNLCPNILKSSAKISLILLIVCLVINLVICILLPLIFRFLFY